MIGSRSLGGEGLDTSNTYLHYDTSPRGKPVNVPEIQPNGNQSAAWVEPVSGERLSFQTVGQAQTTPLIRFYALHGERYVVCWNVNKPSRASRG